MVIKISDYGNDCGNDFFEKGRDKKEKNRKVLKKFKKGKDGKRVKDGKSWKKNIEANIFLNPNSIRKFSRTHGMSFAEILQENRKQILMRKNAVTKFERGLR